MTSFYKTKTIKYLQEEAKAKGLKGISRLKKDSLIAVLNRKKTVEEARESFRPGKFLEEQTISTLQTEAKARGIKGISRLSKTDLIGVLKGEKNKNDIITNTRTIDGLRDIAKEKGFRGYTGLNKKDLETFLRERGIGIKEVVVKRNLKDLKKEAKGKGIKGYSNLTKDQLEGVLNGEINIKDISHIKEKSKAGHDLVIDDYDQLHKSSFRLDYQPLKALKEIARKVGLKGFSKLRRKELYKRLIDMGKEGTGLIHLRSIAYRLRIFSEEEAERKSKKELVNAIRDNIFGNSIDIRLWRTGLNGQVKIYKGFCPDFNPFTDRVPTYIDIPQTSIALMDIFLESIRKRIIEILKEDDGRKVKMAVEVYMVRSDDFLSEVMGGKLARFHSGANEIVEGKTDLDEVYGRMADNIIKKS